MTEEGDQEFCTIISSRKAPQSFSFSYITAVLKLEKLKSLNPSLMNENNHYKHMLTQKETDRKSYQSLWNRSLIFSKR